MAIVEVDKVDKTFFLGDTKISALKSISLSVNKGEFLAIVGPSGSGKSTLLNLIGCIEKPESGRILIDGTDVTPRSLDALAELRSEKIGYIFQTFNLLPVLTVMENVEYPLWLRGVDRKERTERVFKALGHVGLEKFSGHKPRELSGGQRQRVAIARSLVGNPTLILADEPTANLDQKTGIETLQLMRNLNKLTGTTFIFSTHDPKIMAEADRIIEMSDGMITHRST
jgi:putative ABC transport system ATP-binding protein